MNGKVLFRECRWIESSVLEDKRIAYGRLNFSVFIELDGYEGSSLEILSSFREKYLKKHQLLAYTCFPWYISVKQINYK